MPDQSSLKPPAMEQSATLSPIQAPGEFAEAYLDLELQASGPYARFVYRDADYARSLSASLLQRGCGEIAAPYGKILVGADGAAIGMAAWLTGKELRRARLQTTMVISASGLLRDDPSVGPRMRAASKTLLTVADDHFYLSRIAIAASRRRQGWGRWLMQRFLSAAVEAQAARAVLEVAMDSEDALRLYRGCGFLEIGTFTADDPVTASRLQYVHMSHPL